MAPYFLPVNSNTVAFSASQSLIHERQPRHFRLFFYQQLLRYKSLYFQFKNAISFCFQSVCQGKHSEYDLPWTPQAQLRVGFQITGTFPDDLDIFRNLAGFQTGWKISRNSEYPPENLAGFQTAWKVSTQPGKFPDILNILQNRNVSRQPWQFLES